MKSFNTHYKKGQEGQEGQDNLKGRKVAMALTMTIIFGKISSLLRKTQP